MTRATDTGVQRRLCRHQGFTKLFCEHKMLVERDSHRLPRSCHTYTRINMCMHIHVHIYTYVRCISLPSHVATSHWCALYPFQISGGEAPLPGGSHSAERSEKAPGTCDGCLPPLEVGHTLLYPFHHSEQLTRPSLATEGQGIVVL